jgi:hypothetical protein
MPSSRRDFIGQAGQLGVAAALTGCASPYAASSPSLASSPVARGEWDLSWVDRIAAASDRAVFDAPTISEGAVLDTATRYLDNCEAVYGRNARPALAVLNIRTRAVALALTSAAWERYSLGAQYDVKDPLTQQAATRNPYLELAPNAYPGSGAVNALVARGAILLVCDFALGHLANRLAGKSGQTPGEVHAALRSSFVPGAVAVPSGIFGMARAQNAGCALIHL